MPGVGFVGFGVWITWCSLGPWFLGLQLLFVCLGFSGLVGFLACSLGSNACWGGVIQKFVSFGVRCFYGLGCCVTCLI